jgi:hypothetical protein
MKNIFTSRHLIKLFPKVQAKYLHNRLNFIYHVAYINYWEIFEDCLISIQKYNPNFERLYQYYKRTGLVPCFDALVVSFVQHLEDFVSSNKSIMYIVHEDLLISWKY